MKTEDYVEHLVSKLIPMMAREHFFHEGEEYVTFFLNNKKISPNTMDDVYFWCESFNPKEHTHCLAKHSYGILHPKNLTGDLTAETEDYLVMFECEYRRNC